MRYLKDALYLLAFLFLIAWMQARDAEDRLPIGSQGQARENPANRR
jgi:hypothetical protein